MTEYGLLPKKKKKKGTLLQD